MSKVKQEFKPPCDGCTCRDDQINRQRDLIKLLWGMRPLGAATNGIYEANRTIINDATTERDCLTCSVKTVDQANYCNGCGSSTNYHNWKPFK